jgi:plasmid stabilization system protein ParE
MKRYTVVWSPAALRRLAELWVDNPAVRQEISDATDEIESALGERPGSVGEPLTAIARLVVRPPVAVLFRIVELDRQVRVIHIKFWDE